MSLQKRQPAGFTLFELIVVIILVAVLTAVLLGRFLRYQEMAEKTAMEQTAGAIRSALTIQLAGLITRGQMQQISRLAAVNPMNLLAGTQKNYAGEYYDVKPGDIPVGNWYFDLRSRQLVYLVQHGAHFLADRSDNKRVCYKIVLVYNDWLPVSEGGRKEIGGITLKEVSPYSWNIQ